VVTKVAVVPLTVQTLVVVDAKLTVKPELAVATSVSGVPTVCGPGLAKVIVCGVRIVTVAVFEAVAPAGFVTVRIYIVVCAGETLTAVPLVTVIFPGVMTPVPLAKTPVRLADPPAVTAVGLAVKLVIVGSERPDPAVNELHPVTGNVSTSTASSFLMTEKCSRRRCLLAERVRNLFASR
jgi:hypothetical protein